MHDVPHFKPVPLCIWQRNYVLYRDNAKGTYVVVDDVCPHRSAPLSEDRLYERESQAGTETILECGYHGWRFACDGRCVDIPVVPTDKSVLPSADIKHIYANVVSNFGLIFVWLGDSTKADMTKLPVPEAV